MIGSGIDKKNSYQTAFDEGVSCFVVGGKPDNPYDNVDVRLDTFSPLKCYAWDCGFSYATAVTRAPDNAKEPAA